MKGRPRGTKKTGGRIKGTPNKRAQSAEATLDSLGFNALAEMWRMWQDPKSSEQTKARMLCEMAQYQFPKRRALEHSGEDGGPVKVQIVRFGDAEPSV